MSYFKARNDNLASVGLEVVLSVAFGFLGGRWLDGKFDLAPILTFVGLFFGMGAAARFLYRASKRMNARTETDGFRNADAGRSARYKLNQENDDGA